MPQTYIDASVSAATSRPLCVDLDGTLVKSDTLHDSLLALLRSNPRKAFALPLQVVRGKAAFKAYVSQAIDIDVAHLPYNRKLLKFLRTEHANGRKIYLATGADARVAERVAQHLAIFDGVLSSDGSLNLTGKNKLERLKQLLPNGEFDYVGNDMPDLPLLAHSTAAMVANPSARMRARMRANGVKIEREFSERSHPIRAMFRVLRTHQWAKNLLLFLPLLLSHSVQLSKLMTAALAFCCFSLAASSTYILNDLLDLEADRRHHRKQKRPFAAGDLSAAQGIALMAVLMMLAFAGVRFLPGAFSAWLLLYVAGTVAYSSFLKRIAVVDVMVLSGLYTVRILAGGAATQTPPSQWMLGFSVFLFLSLGIAKRFAEMAKWEPGTSQARNGRGYFFADLDQLRAFGTASAYAAVVIFAIYISSSAVTPLYHKPRWLWLVVPLMFFWISRVWLLASRGELDEDPVVFALTDRVSLIVGLAAAAFVLLAI